MFHFLCISVRWNDKNLEHRDRNSLSQRNVARMLHNKEIGTTNINRAEWIVYFCYQASYYCSSHVVEDDMNFMINGVLLIVRDSRFPTNL